MSSIFWLFTHLLNLILFVPFCVGWIGQTEMGTQWAVKTIAPMIQLKIGSIEGRLFHQIQLQNVQYASFSIQKVHLNWQLERLLENNLIFQLKGTDLKWSSFTLSNFEIKGTGTDLQHTLTANLVRNKEQLTLELTGQWTKPIWTGKISQLTLSSPLWQRWTLKQAINLKLSEKESQVSQSCWQSQRQEICAQGNLKNWKQLTALISAQSQAQPLLSLIERLSDEQLPQLKSLQGQLTSQVNITGSISQPRISGIVQLHNGQFRIPELGLQAHNIDLEADIDPQGQMELSGQMRIGKGLLSLTGQWALHDPQAPLLLDLTGINLQVLKTREYSAIASPDLQIHFLNNHMRITGEIFIPQAVLKPIDFSQQSLVLSDDVIFVSQKKTASSPTFSWESDTVLKLGNDVQMAYAGLQGKLQGNLRITDQSNASTLALGELTLDGYYKAYGQNLRIEKGRLLFNGGPIEDPNVALRASKKVTFIQQNNQNQTFQSGTAMMGLGNQLTVGVSVIGDLDEPQITLFSTPILLSQADILSYMVLGYPVSQATKTRDIQLLFKAVSVVGGGANPLDQLKTQLESRLGLSEISVENISSTYAPPSTDPNKNKGVTLGKAISPKLYVSYSMGLFEALNIFRIRYFLLPQVTVQTESTATQNAIDLLYSFEK